MKKILILGIAIVAANASIAQEINPTAPHILLKYYSGDFTDTDGDGMSDVGEVRYGFNPRDNTSYPTADFLAPDLKFTPSQEQVVENLEVSKTESGLDFRWNPKPGNYHDLFLYEGERNLGSGVNNLDSGKEASFIYHDSEITGNETIRGRFIERSLETSEEIGVSDFFTIDLSDYPHPPRDLDLGSPDDKISYRFTNFQPEMKERTIEFLTKLTPILTDVLGPPAETFTCTLIDQGVEVGSWMSHSHGRIMLCDNSWNPRLLVHELIHAWKGKYGFTNTAGDNWEFSVALSGFEEVAEGLAYEILHDYIEAYPNDAVSVDILDWGAWNNWSARASNYDVVKHQRYTQSGEFWTDQDSVTDRYSIAAMTIQVMQKHDENFYKKMMSRYYDKIESDPNWRPNRDDLIDLWASVLPTVNGVSTRAYLDAIPLFNGKNLEGFYPIIMQRPSVRGGDKIIYSSYADREGFLWWGHVTEDNVEEHKIPNWIDKVLVDGFYYINTQNQPYVVNVTNIRGELVHSHSRMSDNYKNGDMPGTLGNVSDAHDLEPSRFPIGLYRERLEFTNYAHYTESAAEDYYFFGYQGVYQEHDEYVIFVGIDSQAAESVSIQLNGKTYTANIENGCAIFRSLGIPHNAEGKLIIRVTGGNKINVYERALVNSGTPDGHRQHQFLVIDKDFDGVEDLYDSEDDIVIDDPVEDDIVIDDPEQSDPPEAPNSPPTFINEWETALELNNGWKYVEWFGYYYDHGASGWIFEENLGWMFRMSFSFDSVWFWTEQLGWIWTSQETYPYVYSSTGGWIFLSPESGVYYDFDLVGWFPWEK